MNSIWTKIVINTVLRKKSANQDRKNYSSFAIAKGFREFRIMMLHYMKDFFLISIGIISATFGLKGFLLQNHFIDGGVTGISLLVSALSSIPLYLLILLINIPFVIMGYTVISKSFAIKTALAITGLAISLLLINVPVITNDNLLVAVFGGVFLGAGIGLSIRGGAVLDGTEVLAIFLSRKLGSTIGDIIIVINILIFAAAAYFLSVEIALYSMVTYVSTSKMLDFVVEGIEEYMGITIISPHSEEIRLMIINDIRRGVTVYSGKRGFGKKDETIDVDIIYTVVTRLELNRLNTEIEKIDPNAFVIMSSIKDTKGGMIKKRPLKHH